MANAKNYSQMFYDMTAHLGDSENYLSTMNIERFKKGVIMALRSYRIAIKSTSRTKAERGIMFKNAMLMLEVARDILNFRSLYDEK